MSAQKKYEVTGAMGVLKPYICGGSAAMFASSCIHPIDLTKVRLQLIGAGSSGGVRPSALSVMGLFSPSTPEFLKRWTAPLNLEQFVYKLGWSSLSRVL